MVKPNDKTPDPLGVLTEDELYFIATYCSPPHTGNAIALHRIISRLTRELQAANEAADAHEHDHHAALLELNAANEVIVEYRNEAAMALQYGALRDEQLKAAKDENARLRELLMWILGKASAAVGLADQPRQRFDPGEIGPAIQHALAESEQRKEGK